MSIYLILFWQGIVTFFTPCFLPLLPVYVVYLSASKKDNYKVLFFNSLAFICGFSTIFILLGAGASTISSYLNFQKDTFLRVMGYFICLLALYYATYDWQFVIKVRAYIRQFFTALKLRKDEEPLKVLQKGPEKKEAKSLKLMGAFLMGCTFSFSWSACISANLGYALALAATSDTMVQGMLLLAVFSLGLAIPFLIFIMLLYKLTKYLHFIQRHSRKLQLLAAVIMFISGLALINGYSLFDYANIFFKP